MWVASGAEEEESEEVPRRVICHLARAWAVSFSGMNCTAVGDGQAGVCANCGRSSDGEGGLVKLKNCTACRLVKYCGVECQKAHRKIHKKACKKRAAELKDERLYCQGHERPDAEFCPICTLPVPVPIAIHACVKVCCMKMVCNGCLLAAMKMGIGDICPFCRDPRVGPGSRG